MSKGKKKGKITFQEAVTRTPDVSNAYERGLRALGQYSSKVQLGDTRQCEGSIDIDGATVAIYPGANRWDYSISYKGEVYFVEVHTASTGEVSTVLRKLDWLKQWLHTHAPLINSLKTKGNPFYWIHTNGLHILPTSAQFKQVVQKNIKPIAKLHLP